MRSPSGQTYSNEAFEAAAVDDPGGDAVSCGLCLTIRL